jgi:hypothetical protein
MISSGADWGWLLGDTISTGIIAAASRLRRTLWRTGGRGAAAASRLASVFRQE